MDNMTPMSYARFAVGNDSALRRYWKYGEGALKIRWGTPGDLTRCHRQLREHLGRDDAWGYCQNLHQEIFGVPNPESGGD